MRPKNISVRCWSEAGILSVISSASFSKEAEATGQRLGQVLIAKGLTAEDQIQQFISIQLGYPPVRLEHTVIEPEVARQIRRNLRAGTVFAALQGRRSKEGEGRGR